MQKAQKIWRIFSLEPETMYRIMIRTIFELHPDFEGRIFSHPKVLLSKLDSKPHIVVMNANFPNMEFKDIFEKIKLKNPATEIICISDHLDHEPEIRNIGITDYIVKNTSFRTNLSNAILQVIAKLGRI